MAFRNHFNFLRSGQQPLAIVANSAAVQTVTDLISIRRGSYQKPLIVAVDGRGGCGKSTLSAAIARRVGAAVIDGDDFYSGRQRWNELTPGERADLCIDWRRQVDVLTKLSNGRAAQWRAYNWDRDNGELSPDWSECAPSHPVVILEGTFSARPELADLIDVRVLVEVAPVVQRARFIQREGRQAWKEWRRTWMSAENFYFREVAREELFDVRVQG